MPKVKALLGFLLAALFFWAVLFYFTLPALDYELARMERSIEK